MIVNYYYLLLKAIMNKGGRYLEAMMQGSKIEAEEGNLVVLAAGDKSLFDDCQSIFCATAKNSFFLGKHCICVLISLQIK